MSRNWLETAGGEPGGGPYSMCSSVGCWLCPSLRCWLELALVAPVGGSYMGGRAALGSYTGGGTACMS